MTRDQLITLMVDDVLSGGKLRGAGFLKRDLTLADFILEEGGVNYEDEAIWLSGSKESREEVRQRRLKQVSRFVEQRLENELSDYVEERLQSIKDDEREAA